MVGTGAMLFCIDGGGSIGGGGGGGIVGGGGGGGDGRVSIFRVETFLEIQKNFFQINSELC